MRNALWLKQLVEAIKTPSRGLFVFTSGVRTSLQGQS
jgi:hypothetical protein